MRGFLYAVLIILLLPSCGQRQRNKTAVAARTAITHKEFPYVSVPVSITGDMERLRYYIEHYWDRFDFADRAYIDNPEISEQGYAGYLAALQGYPDPETAIEAMNSFLGKTKVNSDMYDYFWQLADKYLYDPNSPMRDEELYIVVLNSVISSPDIEDIMKIVPRERLTMAMQNRIGQKANDFSFTNARGGKGSLYGIDADYLILYFYNLGCPMCREVREAMQAFLAEEPFAGMLRSGEIKILALYPDEDMEGWNEYEEDVPADWINGYDRGTEVRKKYDLKAIPSLYLLDRDKKVMLKDAAVAVQLFQSIENDLHAQTRQGIP